MMSSLGSLRHRALRRVFAATAVLLLTAQSAVAGRDLWCPTESNDGNVEVLAETMPSGHQHGSQPEDSSRHHGSDDTSSSACPMMALCTLSGPAPFAGLGIFAQLQVDSPDVASWSVHGALLADSPPPPRV